mgnify:CR=1 FL=1
MRLQPDEIERVVQLLAACKGKIVILGVGKSGIIAQKIAATMTSTGSRRPLSPSIRRAAWRHRHY